MIAVRIGKAENWAASCGHIYRYSRNVREMYFRGMEWDVAISW